VAVKIRLMRVGKRKQPSYRVVVADERKPRDGRFIEIIGHYGPRAEPSVVEIDDEKAIGWLRKGAQPSEAVQKLLASTGVWERFVAERGSDPAQRYETARRVRRERHSEAAAAAAADAAPDAAPEAAAATPEASDDIEVEDDTTTEDQTDNQTDDES
jgi:small subunit ribosomal protein S16